jgi:osomolarity two-component system response regulator SSK1
MQILHQIIGVARPGDTLELGLHVASPPTSTTLESPTSSLEPPRTTLTCSIEITHIYGTLCPPTETEERSDPQFGALLLRRILNHLHATLHTNPATVEEQGKSYLLTLPLLQSPLPSRSPTPSTQSRAPHPSLSLSLATEPSINELTLFAERTLKGKKAIFYASEKSSFAIHLTAYLTAWGMDVSHISTDTPSEEGAPGESEVVDGGAKPKTPGVKPGKEKELEVPPQVISASEDDDPILPIPDPEPTASPSLVSNLSLPPTASDQSFIIIDDSISILREHLIKFRPPSPAPTPPTNSTTSSTTPRDQRPRPQLGSNHRPKSTPHIRQFTPTESTSINKDTLSSPTPIAITATTPTPSTTPGATPKRPTRSRRSTTATAATPPANSIVIVHFTSLTNYKLVKDLVQSLLSSAAQQGYQYPPHPEILVVPKPAGPRRFLTALHTAVYKPVVDPFFTPIATSPFSPGGTGGSWGMGSLFPSQSTSTLGKRNPITPSPLRHPLSPSSPTNSNSRRSPTGHHPTPTLEYFSETAPKLSAQSAASGVVLQSPDGTPAGIFFQPQPQPSSLREQRFESVMMERSNATMGPSDADDGKSSDNAEIARVQQQQRRKSSRMTPTGENQPKDIASVPLSPSQSATSTASASRNLPSVLGSLAELVKSGVPLDSASRQSSPIRPTAHPLTEHSSSESMMPNSQDSSMTKVPTLASTSPPASPTIASARPPMKKEGRSLSKSGEVPKAKGKHDRKDDEIVPPIRVLVVEGKKLFEYTFK